MKSAILATATVAACFALALNASATEPLLLGNPAPEFELADQTGQLHSLEDYREQWVVLYFYPKDETPGCTTEACGFSRQHLRVPRFECTNSWCQPR